MMPPQPLSQPRSAPILVVEDDSAISNLIDSLLRSEGYAVRLAFNGQEGLVAVKEQSPGLVLADLTMPVMGGAEFCQRVDAGGYGQVPVILLTAARETPQIDAQCVVDYLAKPFDIDDLLAVIEQHYRAV